MSDSEIRKFYKGRSVFVTGGTGFMGKILIEKLLRSTETAKIFLLIRKKQDKSLAARIDNITSNVIFEKLNGERPDFKSMIVGVEGDCSLPGLGLKLEDRQKLVAEIEIVFHVAATVSFNENIKLAFAINVQGTESVVELCKEMTNVKSIVHVSTAYSNSYTNEIDEIFYDCPDKYNNVAALLEKMTLEQAQVCTSEILGKWPNTYTYTKALAESLLRSAGMGLPIVLFRPSMVMSTAKEPIEGWCEGLNGPAGGVVGTLSGLLRIAICDKNKVVDMVPADKCISAIIAAAWDISNKSNEKIPIYNYVSYPENSITWNEFRALTEVQAEKYPLSTALWTLKFAYTKNAELYSWLIIILHLIPGFLMDAGGLLFGKKPKILKIYRNIHKFSDVTKFFTVKEYVFRNDNVQELWRKMNGADRKLFPLSLTTLNWIEYSRHFVKGLRVYVLKDNLDTLPQARIRNRRFRIAHHFLIFFLYLGAISLFSFFWSFIMPGKV